MLDWLMTQAQSTQCQCADVPGAHVVVKIFEPSFNGSQTHEHGYATWALAMAYGMSFGADNEFQRARLKTLLQGAVHALERCQSTQGGWEYTLDDGQSNHEGSTTVTALQALRAAKEAGLRVGPVRIRNAIDYLGRLQVSDGADTRFGGFRYRLAGDSSEDRVTFALTAASIASLNETGDYDSKVVDRGVAYMRQRDPLRRGARQKQSMSWRGTSASTPPRPAQYRELRHFGSGTGAGQRSGRRAGPDGPPGLRDYGDVTRRRPPRSRSPSRSATCRAFQLRAERACSSPQRAPLHDALTDRARAGRRSGRDARRPLRGERPLRRRRVRPAGHALRAARAGRLPRRRRHGRGARRAGRRAGGRAGAGRRPLAPRRRLAAARARHIAPRLQAARDARGLPGALAAERGHGRAPGAPTRPCWSSWPTSRARTDRCQSRRRRRAGRGGARRALRPRPVRPLQGAPRPPEERDGRARQRRGARALAPLVGRRGDARRRLDRELRADRLPRRARRAGLQCEARRHRVRRAHGRRRREHARRPEGGRPLRPHAHDRARHGRRRASAPAHPRGPGLPGAPRYLPPSTSGIRSTRKTVDEREEDRPSTRPASLSPS